MEKSTRVKARVKAHAFKEIVSVKDEVYVMGHRMGDADSFGASVGPVFVMKLLVSIIIPEYMQSASSGRRRSVSLVYCRISDTISQADEAYDSIVLNDIGASMQPMIDMFRNSDGYEEDMIVNNAQALEMVGLTAYAFALYSAASSRKSFLTRVTSAPFLRRNAAASKVLTPVFNGRRRTFEYRRGSDGERYGRRRNCFDQENA